MDRPVSGPSLLEVPVFEIDALEVEAVQDAPGVYGPALVEGRQLAAAATKHVHQLALGDEKHGSCTPNAWVDYVLEVDAAMTDTNLIFEVEDKGDSYNPEALMVAIWEYAVPSDRAAEHRTERASGKVWAVGMNNECFVVGNITLGIRCSPFAAVDFKVKVVVVQASISPGEANFLEGEVRAPVPMPAP